MGVQKSKTETTKAFLCIENHQLEDTMEEPIYFNQIPMKTLKKCARLA